MAASIFSNVRIKLTPEEDKIKARVTVLVAEAMYLTGLTICQGKFGLFLNMPNKKNGRGEMQDICFPANKATRDELAALALEAYKKELALTAV